MKATVWTSWNVMSGLKYQPPKCIWIGEISAVPREGEKIVVRDGFGAETVKTVIHNFASNEVEIRIDDNDPGNEYGDCLLNKKEGANIG